MIEIAQIRAEQVPAVQQMIKEYLAWSYELQEGSAEAPTFQTVDDELRDLEGFYSPPRSRLLVASIDGQVSGCIALKPVDETTGEVKRLYVKPEARGHQLGTKLIAALIEVARQSGYRKLILDSHKKMPKAHELYRGAGFVDVTAPPNFPKSLVSYVVFMELNLSTVPA